MVDVVKDSVRGSAPRVVSPSAIVSPVAPKKVKSKVAPVPVRDLTNPGVSKPSKPVVPGNVGGSGTEEGSSRPSKGLGGWGIRIGIAVVLFAIILLIFVPIMLDDSFVESGGIGQVEALNESEVESECREFARDNYIDNACRGVGGMNVYLKGTDDMNVTMSTAMFYVDGAQVGEFSVEEDGFVSFAFSNEALDSTTNLSIAHITSSRDLCELSSSFDLVDC